jgi:hypothetical protein
MTVDVLSHTGSGTFALWTVNVGGTTPLQSIYWGEILGTLGDQSDLATALNDKLELSGGVLDANSTIQVSTATQLAVFGGSGLNVELSANPSENSVLNYGGLQVQNFSGTMAVTPSGLTFPNASTQTVAYPGSTGFLLKADNLSGLADTSVSRTNLGLGTMATATAADYSTTTAANLLYYPLSGNPSAFLVAADITGKAPLASPALTGNVTITSSTGAALFITQTGTGNILTLHDQAADTNFVAIDANGKVSTIASEATNGAGFNVAHGVAPTSPVNGDIWTTTSGLFARINAGTQQFAALSTNNTFSNASSTYGNSTAAGTINIGTGATLTATTKAINIGTNGVSGSTTNITLGSATSGATNLITVNGPMTVGNNFTATGLNINIGNLTATAFYNFGTGALVSGATRTIGIGTNALAGSTNTIAIGSTAGTSTTTLQGTTTFAGPITAAINNISLGSGTAAQIMDFATGVTATGLTKAVSIGTNGAAGSTTTIAIGGTAGTSTTTLQGTTNGVTAAADTNSVALATTAFVVGQAGSATPLVNGTAAVGTSLRYARQDHVHGTDTTRAPLASPTFSGTPSLPTGTTAVTQTAGNNTTALATTAFVTAAVPALASTAQVVAATSTSTSLAPGNQGFILANPRLQSLAFTANASVSGSGANATTTQTFSRQMFLASLAVGRSAYLFGAVGSSNAGFGTSTAKADQVDFSKKVWIAGYAMMGHGGATSYLGDANTMCRISLGGYSTQTTGDMTLKGIGLKKVGGAASTVSLTVHNGTTLTDVASSVTVPDGGGIHWQIYSDGTGNVTLYINGTQAATTTAGPTTATASGQACYREQVEAVATPGVRHVMNCNGGWFYTE